ncbi:MAG: molybdopterin-dependent oxidoreductase FAD-binding subunit [Neisseriales bacterium]|nr:MAG: molybdopterin-dependent oxidoreductase FAD-binding subunit [Neisseriales bacterium]
MIVQFFKPNTIAESLALKAEYGRKAAYMGGGSKLNSAAVPHHETIAISLSLLKLDGIVKQGKQLEIGATASLQNLVEHMDVPYSLKEAAKLIYSRHLRNQATLGGEIAASQDTSVLLPILLVLEANLLLDNGEQVTLERYLSERRGALIQKVVLPDVTISASTRKISHTVDGLITLTAAVSLTATGSMRIALDGVTDCATRLRAVEAMNLEGEALERAVTQAIKPKGDILRGSSEYKSYIAGIVVADLLVNCQQQGRK